MGFLMEWGFGAGFGGWLVFYAGGNGFAAGFSFSCSLNGRLNRRSFCGAPGRLLSLLCSPKSCDYEVYVGSIILLDYISDIFFKYPYR